jgi:multicomponent Na+:H+ antiporter subunit D
MAVGAMALRTGSVTLTALAGIGRRMPVTTLGFTVAGLSLVGVPGTAGFVSKWYLVVGAFERGWWWMAFVIAAGSLLAVVYLLRFLEIAWFREPPADAAAVREAPADMLVPILVIVGATVFAGIDTKFTAAIADRVAALLLADGVP